MGERLPSRCMAFAVAAMLRFLTPQGPQPLLHKGIFKGRMDPRPALAPPGALDQDRAERAQYLC